MLNRVWQRPGLAPVAAAPLLPPLRPATPRSCCRGLQPGLHTSRQHTAAWQVRGTLQEQTQTALETPQPCPGAAELTEFLLLNGGALQGVQLVQLPCAATGRLQRQLRATQDLPAGAVCITVPKACQLRYDAITDPQLAALCERIPQGQGSSSGAWQFKQALLLLWHQARGAASPLYPHLVMLPGAAPGVPTPCIGMRLHDDAVPELQYAPLQEDVHNHKYWWRHWVQAELAGLPGSAADPFSGTAISSHMFGQAVAVTMSRCFGLKRAATHSMPAVIDMADHALASNCEIQSDAESSTITLTTKAEVKAGHPLTLTYGPHPNTELLLSYGFVLPANSNDTYLWDFDSAVLAEVVNALCGEGWVPLPLPAWKLDALGQLDLAFSPSTAAAETTRTDEEQEHLLQLVQRQRVWLGGDGDSPVDPRLLAATRLLLLQEADPPSIREGVQARLRGGTLGDWGQPLARQHEVGVMQALQALVSAIYQSFPSTIQEDRLLLQKLETGSLDLPPAARAPVDGTATWMESMVLAVSFRLQLKLTLEGCLKRLRQRRLDLSA